MDEQETTTRLAKLDNLLEKAGIYSSFLFSNLSSAATVADEAPEETSARGKRKRGRVRSSGTKKLKQMQSDGKLDTHKPSVNGFQQPKLLTGGDLRDYQLEGIRWLCNLFENGLNGILADEMGLGKTIQVIGMIAHLRALGVRGPYLIVAPLSTLTNWEQEFHKWTPSMPCLIYHGTKADRKSIRQKQLQASKMQDEKFPIVITSYEMILQDRSVFDRMGFVWKYMVVDEGHRLKNLNCRLVRELKTCKTENRLLLTGTPLQNDLTELWSLLNFILPDVFDDLALFESWFSLSDTSSTSPSSPSATDQVDVLSGDKRAEVISKLHEILRPFLLRRLKTDVVQELPSKTEIFVYCPMSRVQKDYYQMIIDGTLARYIQDRQGKSKASAYKSTSLRNKAMQLRKCCNHPFLFDEPTDADGEMLTDESLVQASGKLVVLDQMLRELKRRGHKVLIFSQMTSVLDILEDFVLLRRWKYCRLDGSTDLASRKEQMETFNASLDGADDDMFCFLLSTRAGGLGINLMAADTVIFFDSDWNPQQDNQAQDRAHRIGQKKDVLVYRLVTENSFENRMLARALEKRKLDRVVIQRGHFRHQNQDAEARRDTSMETSDGVTRVSKALTTEELQELLRDDVLIRDGVENGGISKKELMQICNRKLVVDSFIAKETKGKVLASKGDGYEIVENARATLIDRVQ